MYELLGVAAIAKHFPFDIRILGVHIDSIWNTSRNIGDAIAPKIPVPLEGHVLAQYKD